MIDSIKQIDIDLFLWLNGQGHPLLDDFMLFMSAKMVWAPLYLLLIYLLYREYSWQFWKPLILIIIAVTLADQTTSSFMKPFFERLRPCHDATLEGVINVGKCGGRYGFASSHAANTFALATFYFTLFRNKWAGVLLVWAAVVSYSRIYLGVHFPADILVGGLLGAIFGFSMASISNRITRTPLNPATGSI